MPFVRLLNSTPQGEVIGFEGWSMRVRLDEDTLKQIANITHGEYFYAGNAVDLKKVYENLNSRLVLEKKETSDGKRGVVKVETKGINQRGEEVCYFKRKVLVWKRDEAPGRKRPYDGEDIWADAQ